MAVYYDVFDIGCTGSENWKVKHSLALFTMATPLYISKIHEGVVRCFTATLFQELKDCLHLAARHRIKPMIEIRKMESIRDTESWLKEGSKGVSCFNFGPHG